MTFGHRPQIAARKPLDSKPQYTAGSTHYLFPADFATVYDLNPLYSAGTSGAGISIAIAGRSNIDMADVEAFRTIAGLPANAPEVTLAGTDPGLVANDQDEATLDVECTGAVAPQALVKLVAASSTATTDGVDLAAALYRESCFVARDERELRQFANRRWARQSLPFMTACGSRLRVRA